jgi:hypothetical protein
MQVMISQPGAKETCRPPDVFESRDILVEWFKMHDFRDTVGHPLANNLDFLKLVDLAFEHKEKSRKGSDEHV